MSGLQIAYSKEVAKELTKIAVCLPGSPVKVGQIIHFPFGKSGIWSYRQAAPRGAFNLITTLENLGVQIKETGPDSDGDPYVFSSRKSVKIDVNFGATGNVGAGAVAQGELNIAFESEGAVYFAATDCQTNSISNLNEIKVDLEKHSGAIIWDDTFLVTSVTIAKKALIMQSSTKTAALSVQGDIKGLITGSAADINGNAEISIKSFKESSFIKPWSENVTVFMGLHRFKKENFSDLKTKGISTQSEFQALEAEKIATRFINSPNDKFTLEPVSAFDILEEEDFKSFD